MKYRFLIVVFLTICSFNTFISCQTDDTEIQYNRQSANYVSVEQVMALITEPALKNSILRTTNSILKNKDRDDGFYDLYFEKIVMPEETHYSLLVNEYSEDKPYYL